jgi:5-methylcytosine-specific restriction protein A
VINLEPFQEQLRARLPWPTRDPGTDSVLPEEIVQPSGLVEGAVRSITVNAYERNPEARQQCIEAHGTTCCICGFSFGAVYGKVAEGYIHVHHLRPLSEVNGEYVVDPVKDLRPVCPNCHAVLHLGGQCRSIEEVKQLVEHNRA